jgi:hypothetical protein
MPEEDLLSTLRGLPEDPGEPVHEQIITQLVLQNNHLESIALKLAINNELLIQISEVQKEQASSDFGAQARPIRNKPFPSPIRRRYESNYD